MLSLLFYSRLYKKFIPRESYLLIVIYNLDWFLENILAVSMPAANLSKDSFSLRMAESLVSFS